jgi:hypothetical protein
MAHLDGKFFTEIPKLPQPRRQAPVFKARGLITPQSRKRTVTERTLGAVAMIGGDIVGVTEQLAALIEGVSVAYVSALRNASPDVVADVRAQLDHAGGLKMSGRRRLPNRRRSESFELECGGLRYSATVSWFDDGSLAEIFLRNHKVGSAADINARDAAIVSSIALQYGAPLDVIRHALLRDTKGVASSPLGVALDRIADGGGNEV